MKNNKINMGTAYLRIIPPVLGSRISYVSLQILDGGQYRDIQVRYPDSERSIKDSVAELKRWGKKRGFEVKEVGV